jgi:hypothetical protein
MASSVFVIPSTELGFRTQASLALSSSWYHSIDGPPGNSVSADWDERATSLHFSLREGRSARRGLAFSNRAATRGLGYS